MSIRQKLRYGPWTAQPTAVITAWSASGQTGSLPAFDLLGGSGNLPVGLYRVSLLLGIDVAGSAGTLKSQVTAVAKTGSVTYSLPAKDVTVVGLESGQFVVESNGTATISAAVIAAGFFAGSLSFSYRYVIEQIDDQA